MHAELRTGYYVIRAANRQSARTPARLLLSTSTYVYNLQHGHTYVRGLQETVCACAPALLTLVYIHRYSPREKRQRDNAGPRTLGILVCSGLIRHLWRVSAQRKRVEPSSGYPQKAFRST